MNFFEQQTQARQRTGWLVCGFMLGLVLVVYAVFVVTTWSLPLINAFGHPISPLAPAWFAAGAGTLLVAGTYFGWRHTDGAALAQAMGAKELALGTADAGERLYLHVVQEMAIAAGCAVPATFVFEDAAINAFVAGGGPDTAVIAVSRGALTHLTRDELQAVVAHEFSHIFNGDMRLHMRMLGALAGVMCIGVAGRVAWHSRRAQWLVVGTLLIVVGGIGLVVAQLIKSAVARQREYLADACAVQFTRNPSGLYRALCKVDRLGAAAGPLLDTSPMREPGASMSQWFAQDIAEPGLQIAALKQAICVQLMGHFFFAPARAFALDDWLATHPSVADRLHAIDPQGQLASTTLAQSPAQNARPLAPSPKPRLHIADGAPIAFAPTAGAARGADNRSALDIAAALRQRIPPSLRSVLNFPGGASAVVQGLLLSARPFVRSAQRDILMEHSNPVMVDAALRAQAQMVDLPQVLRLPLLDLALPALRSLAPTEQEALLKTVHLLVLADGNVNAFELMTQVLLQRVLRPEPLARTTGTAAQHMRVVLSYIAYCGARGEAQAAHQAYQEALRQVPQLSLRDLLALQECKPQSVRHSMLALSGLSPFDKQRYVALVQACAMRDQVVRVSEWEIVRVVCQCLEVHCPLAPPGLDTRIFIS